MLLCLSLIMVQVLVLLAEVVKKGWDQTKNNTNNKVLNDDTTTVIERMLLLTLKLLFFNHSVK